MWNDEEYDDHAAPTLAQGLISTCGCRAGDRCGHRRRPRSHEFQSPVVDSEDIDMIGGGVLGWQPGEWTDDTSMAIVVLEAALSTSNRHDLRVESAQDQIAREWYSWSLGTPDIGMLTSQVIRRATDGARAAGHYIPRAADFRAAAISAHDDLPATAGNGSLMRTHAAVLPYLLASDDDAAEGIDAGADDTRTRQITQAWTPRASRGPPDLAKVEAAACRDANGYRRQLWIERIEEAEQADPGPVPPQRLGGGRLPGRMVRDHPRRTDSGGEVRSARHSRRRPRSRRLGPATTPTPWPASPGP